MPKEQKVSIIIPCQKIDDATKKCIQECLNLNYSNFEILVLPDKKEMELLENKKIRIIPTEKKKPSFKRNIGMQKAKGNFFAFIDSDAYPKKDWLKNAIMHFKNPKIGIVGGPNLTPKEANFAEQVSGYVYSNFLASGLASIRYKIAKNQFANELPSCNYISKKEISPEYHEGFLTAEDSKFCFDVIKKGYKILYANDVIVYHHRRDKISKHIKQIFIYARDIAWLTKKEFSFNKIIYSILSFFVLVFFTLSISALFNKITRIIFPIFLAIYLLLILTTSIHKNIKTSFYVFLTTLATHFSYGFGWLYGIFKKQK